MLLVGLPVNNGLSEVSGRSSQVQSRGFLSGWGVGAPSPDVFQGSTEFLLLFTECMKLH